MLLSVCENELMSIKCLKILEYKKKIPRMTSMVERENKTCLTYLNIELMSYLLFVAQYWTDMIMILIHNQSLQYGWLNEFLFCLLYIWRVLHISMWKSQKSWNIIWSYSTVVERERVPNIYIYTDCQFFAIITSSNQIFMDYTGTQYLRKSCTGNMKRRMDVGSHFWV